MCTSRVEVVNQKKFRVFIAVPDHGVIGGGMLLPRSSSLNCSVRAPLGLVSPATRKRASPIASIIEACLIGFVRTMRGRLDQLKAWLFALP